MTALSGTTYSMNQASYDLARLRLNGLISRVAGHNRYTLTPDGQQFAIFYAKIHDRSCDPS
jgi:predicted transcriptional regulator